MNGRGIVLKQNYAWTIWLIKLQFFFLQVAIRESNFDFWCMVCCPCESDNDYGIFKPPNAPFQTHLQANRWMGVIKCFSPPNQLPRAVQL